MCLFCKLVNGEIPSNKVLEDENFIAFHDINPIAPIHLLIIPKIHVEKFQDVKAEMMAEMTLFIQQVAQKMELDSSGYRLVTNNGSDGGQEVLHLHFHLLGGTRLKWTHLHDDNPKAAL